MLQKRSCYSDLIYAYAYFTLRLYKPPSHVNCSGWRLTLSWQPHVLPVGDGKQNILHCPLAIEQLGFTENKCIT